MKTDIGWHGNCLPAGIEDVQAKHRGVWLCVERGCRWWVGSRVRTLLLSWLSRLGDPGAPRRPQRPQRPGRSNESTGPQAVRTPALVNEHWESGDPGSNLLGHLEQRAETLTHGCHPRKTRRDVDIDKVCPRVSASASVYLTHTLFHSHVSDSRMEIAESNGRWRWENSWGFYQEENWIAIHLKILPKIKCLPLDGAEKLKNSK